MSSRDDNSWVPVAAGFAFGVGVLALLYRFLSAGSCRGAVKLPTNQQQGKPFLCSCGKGAPVSLVACESAEERARKIALERKRQLAGLDSSQSEDPGSIGGRSPGATWYSVLGGTFLLALTALAVKTGADKDGWARPIYVYFGLAEPNKVNPACGVRINDAKRKFPVDNT